MDKKITKAMEERFSRLDQILKEEKKKYKK